MSVVVAGAAAVVVGIGSSLLPPEALLGVAALLGIGLVVAVTASAAPRALATFGALVNVTVFRWAYGAFVVPHYGYSGLVDVGPDALVLALATVAAVLPVAWMPMRCTRPSEVVLWFLYLFGYVPASIMPVYVLGADHGTVLTFGVLLFTGFLAVGLMQRIPRAAPHWPGLPQRSFGHVMLALGIGCVAYLLVFFGIPTQVPDFVSAYDVRAGFGATQGEVPASAYVVTWAGNVIFPLLMAVGLAWRRYPLLALGVAGQFLLYTQGGAKAVLFNILLVPMLFIAMRRLGSRLGAVLMWGAVVILVVSVAVTALTGSLWPLALYAVRLIALPGQLTAYYLDFFTSHATYELSRSVMRLFVESPYAIDPPTLIGLVYFHKTVNANANMWADALANFGLIGVVPFSILLGVILWTLDSVATNRDPLVFGPTLGIVGLSLANGALLTSILTYGVGLAIILIALMPRTGGAAGPGPPAPGGR